MGELGFLLNEKVPIDSQCQNEESSSHASMARLCGERSETEIWLPGYVSVFKLVIAVIRGLFRLWRYDSALRPQSGIGKCVLLPHGQCRERMLKVVQKRYALWLR